MFVANSSNFIKSTRISRHFKANFIVTTSKLKCLTIEFWIIWKIVSLMQLMIVWSTFSTCLQSYMFSSKKFVNLTLTCKSKKKKNTRRLYRENAQDIRDASNNLSRFNEKTRIEISIIKFANSFVYFLKSSMFRASTTLNFSNISIVSNTHVDFMNLSFSSKWNFFTQVEKKYRRVNNFCNYCEKFEHIVIDHQNSTTLNVKKRIYNFRLVFVQLTSHYNNIIDEAMTKMTKNEKFSS